MNIKYYKRINKLGMLGEYAEFNGIEFRKSDKYYLALKNPIYKNRKRLHIAFYEYHYQCSIIKNNDIHHIDGNPLNNNINNLLLMSHKEHVSLHSKNKKNNLGKKYSNEYKKNMSELFIGNKSCRWKEPTIEMILDFNNGYTRKQFMEKYQYRILWDKIRKNLLFWNLKINKGEILND